MYLTNETGGIDVVMKKKSIGKGFALLCMLTALLSGCSQTQSGSGTLKVGVRDDIMNFSYLSDVTGKYYGLEIDLANTLADTLGYADVSFTTVTADTRKDILLNGEVDCIIATYSIAESREKNFDFSAPYYRDDTCILVENSSLFQDISDLQNKTIGILSGANTGPLLAIKLNELGMISDNVIANTDTQTLYEGMTVEKFATYDELYAALQEGRIDAACMDGCIAKGYLTDDSKLLDISIAPQEYGVATQKDSSLSAPVAAAIEQMQNDGTLDKLIDKWN